MPIKPAVSKLSATSADILNAIRNSASANYQQFVPEASTDLESIREIGAIIMVDPNLQNEFLHSLVNRIGRVMITSKMFSNPWSMFKKGMLDFGETIEEIFVELAKPFQFDPAVAESEVFKREIPDVRAAFHILNYQKFYKDTVSRDQLRQAFLSMDGITDLVTKIINSMYASANYDEFNVMKYLIAKHIINGNFNPVTVPEATDANAKKIASKIKGLSNDYEFMSDKYNKARVHNYTLKENQYLIINSKFDAIMDIEVLAGAFHMDNAQFAGHRVMVDSFGNLDQTRLAELFKDDSTYTTFTSAELEALDAIPAVIVDRDWFMIVDNLQEFTELQNPQGLYWNYWLHVWKTFSVSPFANASVLVPGTPAITSVTVSPSAVTASAGQSVQLSAEVVTTNFASKVVNWTSSDADIATVDVFGNVLINPDADAEDEVTITATSAVDSTKSDSATITVA